MKNFNIPEFYKSPIITGLKKKRMLEDPRKKDYSPNILDCGKVKFIIARHFGFCYGVENAIEISYKAIEENPDKRIYLLSEMIHNPDVNNDLISRGVKFIHDTDGTRIIEWGEITPDDVIIIPAFGTTFEILQLIKEKKLNTLEYDTTCPFVEKVWNRASHLGKDNYTVIVHGKYKHEETRATFSHSKEYAPTIIIRDIGEAKLLGKYIKGEISIKDFFKIFKDKISVGFNPERHLQKIGVVNQTTMLASETQSIADYLKKIICKKYGIEKCNEHFADTRDTLCYATHDNQRSTYALLEEKADLAIVVGGYNSSNTSHLVELCESKFKTYFVSSASNIISKDEIKHFDYHNSKELVTKNFLPENDIIKIILTSGASCPDSVVENVMTKILAFFGDSAN